MQTFIFVCPTCTSPDILPAPNSDAWRIWWVFGLTTCNECDAQFQKARCVEKPKIVPQESDL